MKELRKAICDFLREFPEDEDIGNMGDNVADGEDFGVTLFFVRPSRDNTLRYRTKVTLPEGMADFREYMRDHIGHPDCEVTIMVSMDSTNECANKWKFCYHSGVANVMYQITKYTDLVEGKPSE